jgi:hypothetical protein
MELYTNADLRAVTSNRVTPRSGKQERETSLPCERDKHVKELLGVERAEKISMSRRMYAAIPP